MIWSGSGSLLGDLPAVAVDEVVARAGVDRDPARGRGDRVPAVATDEQRAGDVAVVERDERVGPGSAVRRPLALREDQLVRAGVPGELAPEPAADVDEQVVASPAGQVAGRPVPEEVVVATVARGADATVGADADGVVAGPAGGRGAGGGVDVDVVVPGGAVGEDLAGETRVRVEPVIAASEQEDLGPGLRALHAVDRREAPGLRDQRLGRVPEGVGLEGGSVGRGRAGAEHGLARLDADAGCHRGRGRRREHPDHKRHGTDPQHRRIQSRIGGDGNWPEVDSARGRGRSGSRT